MERVQFQQEQMLAELKDLVQKGLFTQKEVKQIMQKRTVFETALVRRVPKKSDFLRYAAYEMSLEALRRKRVDRLKIAKGAPSVSDYALVRRQFQIFERALKKFKGDVGLWIQYIQVAKKEGARALVGRISARALQLHPNVPSLYVLAASHELEHLSPMAARALLQNGLRLNADSVEMWREYVRMEMGFVESLRRRWDVLGIDVKEKGVENGARKDKAKAKEGMNRTDELASGFTEEEAEDGMEVDTEEDLPEDEAARREIMQGGIVKSVISSAVKAIPTIELFTSLHELISAYPSPPSLREALLDHLHAHLHQTLPSLPAAIKLSATRHLTPELVGETFVDALKTANEQLMGAVRSSGIPATSGVAKAYAEFAEEWCRKDIDDSLKAYLITSMHLLIQELPAPIPSDLLAAHIRLLVSHYEPLGSALLPPKANTPEKILRVSRRHTKKAFASATVWLARLDAERTFAGQHDVIEAWDEARKNVLGTDIERVWLWGLDPQNRSSHSPTLLTSTDSDVSQVTRTDSDVDEQVRLLEHLLHESQLIKEPASATALHEALLIRYAAASHHAILHQHTITRDGRHEATSTIVAPPAARSPPQSLLPQRGADVAAHAQSKHLYSSAFTDARLALVRQIGTAYVSTKRVWAEVFQQESGGNASAAVMNSSAVGARAAGGFSAGGGDDRTCTQMKGGYFRDIDGDARVLRTVYEFWRQKDGVEATVAWATWLLRSGKGKEAVAVIARARSVLGEMNGEVVEQRWKTVLDGTADGQGNAGEDDGEDHTGDAEPMEEA